MSLSASVEYYGEWGRLQIIINNTDRTIYRGIPTEVLNWSSSEPFSDKSLTLRFPGITSYETYASWPFKDFDNVEIWHITNVGTKGSKLFEGFIASTTDDLEPESNGLTVECLGALYQADFFIKTPAFGFAPEDAGFAIATEMNLRAANYGLRTKQMNWLTYSSTPTRSLGSWNKMLTGWAQELLSQAYTPPYMFDDETANGVAVSEDGYWIMGDHGTFCVFGDRMPNHGSSTWWNAIFIHLFKDPGLYCTDVWYDRDRKEAYYLSRDGHVGRRLDFKSDSPGFDPWYGEPLINSDRQYIAIHGTDNMAGYRTLNIFGQVHGFGDVGTGQNGDGALIGQGPVLPPVSFTNGTVFPDIYIDMARTPSGNGYYIMTWGGRVYAYDGDANNDLSLLTGQLPLQNDVWVAFDITPDNAGLYALDTNGRVYTKGTAVHYGDATGTGSLSTAWRDIAVTPDGDGYIIVRSDGYIRAFGSATNLGDARFTLDATSGSNVSQYTMTKLSGRRPVIRTKDTWTTDYTYTTGTPGVTHNLNRDRTQMPNVFFGEGTNGANCKWRNTRYPNFYPGAQIPNYPGYEMGTTANSTADSVAVWQRRMQQLGWPIAVDGHFDNYDANIARLLQHASGIQVTGTINAQTWTQTFQPGGAAGDLDAAYIAPLALDNRVEPFRYSADGSVIGDNPNFDTSVMRVETYNNYGEKSSRREAQVSAWNEIRRNADPGYYGTITLKVDPEEQISRFEFKAGQNILLKSYRGEDVLFHISGVEVDFPGQTVTCTVDSKARDMGTLGAMLDRDRSIGDPPLKPTRPDNASKSSQDENVVFDCESKAGFIPWFATPGLSWNVIRIPMGEVGTVVKTEFRTIFPATPFAIAVFDREVTTNWLNLAGDPEVPDYWKEFPEDWGLIISWGSDGQMCGFYPGRESDDDGVTGRFVDAGSWNFWSSKPPWIWVGIWALNQCAISGRFYPGPDAGFNFASTDSIANPMEISNTARPTAAYFGDYP